MKKYSLIIIAILLTCWSCQDDPMSELDDIEYHEKDIFSIDLQFEELGKSTFNRYDDSAVARVFYLQPTVFDKSSVEIISLGISYGATSFPDPGDALDFDNPSMSAQITVTPQVGEPLEWTIYLKEVPLGLEELKRTLLEDSYFWWLEISTPWKTVWNVKDYYINDEKGTVEGTAGDEMEVRPAWADAALDNTLTLNDDGTFIYDAGPDGLIGGPGENGYDILTLTEGRWYYKDGSIYFSDPDNEENNEIWPVNVDLGFQLKNDKPQEHWIMFE